MACAADQESASTDSDTTLPVIKLTASKKKLKTSAAIGKTTQDIKEIPQSVTVISQERIEQQALKTLDDVMLQTTGVTREQLWLNNNYYARGLQIKNIRYDGGATSAIADRNNNADIAQFEEVSILRGADGLFGAGDAGGVINLQSKRPKDTFGTSASVSIGSWNNYRTEVDVTGPISEYNDLKGRAVAVFQDQDHFFKPSHSRREMLYGSLQADVSPDTTLVVGASYQKDRQEAFNASLPRYIDGADAYFPRSTTMGAPWGWLERENISAFATLSHNIHPDWKLNLNIRHTMGDDAINGAEMEGGIDYATLQSDWWRYQDQTKAQETLADLNIQGSFELFNQKHDMIFGLDSFRSVKNYNQNWTQYGSGNAFDREPPPEWVYPQPSWDTTSNRNSINTSSTYDSIRIRPIADLSLIVGGRYTFHETQKMLNKKDGVKNNFKQDNDFIPYYGIVYDVLPNTSLYGSYAEIYQSQLNYFSTDNGPSLEPATGKNIEFGIKSKLLNQRVMVSLAYFDIKKQKEAAYVSRGKGSSNTLCCYTATGNKQSKGVDIELTGKLIPQWDISLGYTYNNNENNNEAGIPFSSITPKHLLKLWSNYSLSNHVDGLSIGMGVTAQSKNYQSGWLPTYNPVTNTYAAPWNKYEFIQKPYAIWSLRAAYNINPTFTIAANLNNVTDKRYYSTVGTSGYGNFYGEPRNVLLSLKAKY
jgi:outer membrane receptor for ferric coprogen and ferric-rhodotorulic acid